MRTFYFLFFIYILNGTLSAQYAIDSTFASNGLLFRQATGGSFIGSQSNGKLIFGNHRYDVSGNLDSSFLMHNVVSSGVIHPNTYAIQPDDKIVVGGYINFFNWIFTVKQFALSRYNANGSLDLSFGANGVVTETLSNYTSHPIKEDYARKVIIQPDGKILVVGIETVDFQGVPDYSVIAVRRYFANGDKDTTFLTPETVLGNDTVPLLASYPIRSATSTLLLSNGKLLIAGHSPKCQSPNCPSGIPYIRLNSNGLIDSSFGNNGIAYTFDTTAIAPGGYSYSATTMAASTNGKIICAENTPPYRLSRIDSTGKQDSTFGVNGYQYLNITAPYLNNPFSIGPMRPLNIKKMFVLSNGSMALTGSATDGYSSDLALFIVDSNGIVDSICYSGYKFSGILTFPYNPNLLLSAYNFASGALLDQQNNIYISGRSVGTGTINFLARFKIDLPSSTTVVSACEHYSFNNLLYNQSGFYTDTIQSVNGCDSVWQLDLTILEKSDSNLVSKVCGNFTLNNKVYNQSGIYYDTIVNAVGCASSLVINLTVNHVDTGVIQNGIVLSAVAQNATYQWFKCNTGLDIVNATNSTFTPPYNGDYAVIVSENGCTDTSACYTVNTFSLANSMVENTRLYPNPSNEKFTLDFHKSNQTGIVRIYNLEGALVYEKNFKNSSQVDIYANLSEGVYIVKCATLSFTFTEKIVIAKD